MNKYMYITSLLSLFIRHSFMRPPIFIPRAFIDTWAHVPLTPESEEATQNKAFYHLLHTSVQGDSPV